jgi:hypothetical protein
MADKIKLVQGDTGPQLRLTFTDEDTGTPTDLSNATVTLHFRALGDTTPIFSRQAYVNPQTATTGIAVLSWQAGDLDVAAGDYEGEIEVVRSSGVRETIYELLKFKVREDFA